MKQRSPHKLPGVKRGWGLGTLVPKRMTQTYLVGSSDRDHADCARRCLIRNRTVNPTHGEAPGLRTYVVDSVLQVQACIALLM